MSPVSSRTIRMSSPETISGLRVEALRQFRIDDGRAQVGEQVELLAEAQQAALGTLRAGQRVVLRTADGAEQHGVGGLREREGGSRQGIAAAS
jgi:hypothetical protein